MLIDYVTTIGLDAIKDKVSDAHEQNVIRGAIKQYVESQEKFNYRSALEEEIDFQGLTDYICGGLHNDVHQRLFGQTSKIRGRARNSVIECAIAYAHAETIPAQNRVKKFVADSIDILRKFYWDNCRKEFTYIAGLIVDDLKEIGIEQHVAQTKQIESLVHTALESERPILAKEIAEQVHIDSPLALEENMHLLKAGKISQVGDNLTDFMRTMSAQHELFPHYGYNVKIDGGNKFNLLSIPLTEEALHKYPPRFHCEGTISLGGKYITQLTSETYAYAYNHQEPLVFRLETARKLLGDMIDPQQYEAEKLVGTEMIMPPKPFPEARAYSMMLDGVSICDFVLLRLHEKFEDGTIILTNDEQQNCSLGFRITANIRTKAIEYTVNAKGSRNYDTLCFRRFLKAISQGNSLAIHDLDSNQNLIEGKFTNCQFKNDSNSLDDEIEFLEKIISIEEYFNEELVLPDQFLREDIDAVNYLARIIKGEQVHRCWANYTITIKIADETKDRIMGMGENTCALYYTGIVIVNVFGYEHKFMCKRRFASMKINEYEKLLKKLDVLDIGEKIKIMFVPEDGETSGEYFDQLITDGDSIQGVEMSG